MTGSAQTFHLHMVSDATGETLIAAARAAGSQFPGAHVVEHVYPLVRTRAQLDNALREIEANPGIVLHTLLDKELSERMASGCRELGLPAIAVLAPVIDVFQAWLGKPAGGRRGGQHLMDDMYYRRIEALDFAMEHDDGQMLNDIDHADIVLVGISRTSKTPTSIYLANRGYKTANVPLVAGKEPPPQLVAAAKPLTVGLHATASRIAAVRRNRDLGQSGSYDGNEYVDETRIVAELNWARRICERENWPLIDVSRRSIEETAAEILALRHRQR